MDEWMDGWMESMINKKNRKKIFTDEIEVFRECFYSV